MTHTTMDKQCNCCGKKIEKVDDRNKQDYLKVDKTWGYFSDKDLMQHSFIVCESCYDAWVKTFTIPIREKEILDIFEFVEDSYKE